MQSIINDVADTGVHTFERLFDDFRARDAKLDILCRRIQCVRPVHDAQDRIKRLEDRASREIDLIARIALRLSEMPSKDAKHVKLKAIVLWSLIKDEEPESVSEALLHSLCRDLLDL